MFLIFYFSWNLGAPHTFGAPQNTAAGGGGGGGGTAPWPPSARRACNYLSKTFFISWRNYGIPKVFALGNVEADLCLAI